MATENQPKRPTKKALWLAVLFGLLAVALPWISLGFAFNLLLVGQVIVMPWATCASIRRARRVAAEGAGARAVFRAAPHALIVIAAALVAVASLAQLSINLGWLPPPV